MTADEATPPDLPALYEHDPLIVFALDRNFRLIYCNSAWERFAEANGGELVRRDNVIGCDLLEVTPQPLRSYYLNIYDQVLYRGEDVSRIYECSSPLTYRRFRMRLTRKDFEHYGSCVVVSNDLVLERPRLHPSAGADPEEFRDENGLITMCSHCRRVKLPVAAGEPWVWETRLERSMPPGITHGLCPACLGTFYGSLGLRLKDARER